MRSFVFFCLLAASGTPMWAEAPEVPSNTPYIVLADNLDEPNGYGFCLDTAGRNLTDLLHAHSCKPVRNNSTQPSDTQFTYDAVNKRVESVAYPGVCMQVLTSPYITVFGLLECSDHARQKFDLSADDKTLRMVEDPSKCVGVSETTVRAGPWVRRDLVLTTCSDADAARTQWTFAE